MISFLKWNSLHSSFTTLSKIDETHKNQPKRRGKAGRRHQYLFSITAVGLDFAHVLAILNSLEEVVDLVHEAVSQAERDVIVAAKENG